MRSADWYSLRAAGVGIGFLPGRIQLREPVAGEVGIAAGGILGEEILPGPPRSEPLGRLVLVPRIRFAIGRPSRCARGRRKRKFIDQRRGKPRGLLAAGRLRHAGEGAVEDFFDLAGRSDRLEQLGHEQRTVAVSHHHARRGGVHHSGILGSNDRRESGRNAAEATLERISPRRVENGNLDACTLGIHLGQDRIEIEPVTTHVSFGPDLCVDRNDVGLPVRLNSIPAEENQRGRVGLDLAVESLDRRSHRLLGEVLANIDFEPQSLEFVGKGARVARCFLQGPFGVWIICVADRQRHASSRFAGR